MIAYIATAYIKGEEEKLTFREKAEPNIYASEGTKKEAQKIGIENVTEVVEKNYGEHILRIAGIDIWEWIINQEVVAVMVIRSIEI